MSRTLIPPETVAAVSAHYPNIAPAWLDALPGLIGKYVDRWKLTLSPAFTEGVASWKAPALTEDGRSVVLKLAVPSLVHGAGASDALDLWDGHGAVRLLAHNAADFAMLLERCEPGSTLQTLTVREANLVLVSLFQQLWIMPPEPTVFMPLKERVEGSGSLTADRLRASDVQLDRGILDEVSALPDELSVPGPHDRLLFGDLGIGNVLLSARGWLAIDPSPLIGDPAYDAARAIVQRCDYVNLADQIALLADGLSLDRDRIARWLLAETMGALGWFVHIGDREGASMRLEHVEAVTAWLRRWSRA